MAHLLLLFPCPIPQSTFKVNAYELRVAVSAGRLLGVERHLAALGLQEPKRANMCAKKVGWAGLSWAIHVFCLLRAAVHTFACIVEASVVCLYAFFVCILCLRIKLCIEMNICFLS